MGLPRGLARCWRDATADAGIMPATPQPKTAVAMVYFTECVNIPYNAHLEKCEAKTGRGWWRRLKAVSTLVAN